MRKDAKPKPTPPTNTRPNDTVVRKMPKHVPNKNGPLRITSNTNTPKS